jgi:hypothetical protein
LVTGEYILLKRARLRLITRWRTRSEIFAALRRKARVALHSLRSATM